MDVKRGDIFMADLNPIIGSEQGGVRPVVVIQNNLGNRYSPTVIVAAITGRDKHSLPTHVRLTSPELPKDSQALLEQIRTLDKRRLRECMGRLGDTTMDKVNKAISISFGLYTEDEARKVTG